MATTGRFFRAPRQSFFLFGPRGTGKTTWLKSEYPDAVRLDLLDPETQRGFLARPERLREIVTARPDTATVVIDEVQKAPELLSVVHQLMALSPSIRFVLTGSSSRKLRREGVDLLAGRALLRSLHPFLAAELGAGFDLDRSLRIGHVPLVLGAESPEETLRSYVALYLREEVQMEGLVRRMDQFARFLEVVSFSHAAVLNTADVARDAQVSRKTVEGYLGVLEDLLLAYRLPVFTRRAGRQLTSHPKFYLFDAGVYRSLRPSGPLDRPEEIAGAALEGLVAQHLRAWTDYSGADSRLFFWRTRAGTEVDFVVYGSDGLWAIEVMHAATILGRDVAGLRRFREDYPMAQARLLYRGRDTLEIDGVRCIPCQEFLRRVIPGQPLP